MMASQPSDSDNLFLLVYEIVSKVNKGDKGFAEILNELYRLNPSCTLILNALTTYHLEHSNDPEFNSKDFGDLLCAFQSNGILNSSDIIANFDPHKLDSFGYSKGLFSIAIKEKTKKFYTLNIYNLWRENPKGFNSVYYALTHFPDEIPYLTSKYFLCPRKLLMLSLIVLSDNINEIDTEDILELQLFKFITKFTPELITSIVCIRSTCKSASQDHPWLPPSWWRLLAILAIHNLIDVYQLYKIISPNEEELNSLTCTIGKVNSPGNKPISSLLSSSNCNSISNSQSAMPITGCDDHYRLFVYKGWRLSSALVGVDYEDWGFANTQSPITDSTSCDANIARLYTCSMPKFQLLGHLHSEFIANDSYKMKQLPKIYNGHFNYYILQGLATKLNKLISLPIHDVVLKMITMTLKEIGGNLSLLPHQYINFLNFLINNSTSIPQSQMDTIIVNSLFPSLILSTRGNVQPGDLIWDLISTFPSWRRYHLYSTFEKKWLKNSISYDDNDINLSIVSNTHNEYKKSYRGILKRVTSSLTSTNSSSSTSKKVSARATVSTVSGIAAVDPWAIVQTGLFQAETFPNLIPSVVETGKYLPKLTLDIYFKYIVKSMADSKLLKVIHGELAGRLFKRHFNADIEPLLLFLTEKLIETSKNATFGNQPIQILEYLSKFITFGANLAILPPTEALTIEQILCQAGGPLLAAESLSIGNLRGDEGECKSKIRLRKGLDNGNLIQIIQNILKKLLYESLYDWDVTTVSIDSLNKFVDTINETLKTLDLLQQQQTMEQRLKKFDESFASYLNDKSQTKSENVIYKYELLNNFNAPDIYYPESLYDSIISRLDTLNIKKKNKRYAVFRESLLAEKETMSNHYNLVEDKKLILNIWENGGHTATISLVTYISKRLFISELDTLFCSKLVWYLCDKKAPGFNFWEFTNMWTRGLLMLISNTTQKEASLLALFVRLVMEPLSKLVIDEHTYFTMISDNPAFSKRLPPNYTTNQHDNSSITNMHMNIDNDDIEYPKFEEFLTGMKRWETRILRVLSTPLQLMTNKGSDDCCISWVESKSAVLFLSRLQGIFPTNHQVAECLQFGLENLENFAKSKDWKDIKVAASTLRKRACQCSYL